MCLHVVVLEGRIEIHVNGSSCYVSKTAVSNDMLISFLSTLLQYLFSQVKKQLFPC